MLQNRMIRKAWKSRHRSQPHRRDLSVRYVRKAGRVRDHRKNASRQGLPIKCCLPILLELIWYGGSDPEDGRRGQGGAEKALVWRMRLVSRSFSGVAESSIVFHDGTTNGYMARDAAVKFLARHR